MTIRIWPPLKSGTGETSYIPNKVIDKEKIGKITELCQNLLVECHVIEDASSPTTKIIITIPYKEEE